MKLSRRQFMQRFAQKTGCFVALASALPLTSRLERTAFAASDEGPSRVTFPQGVASADPQPDAIMLWTRALPVDGGNDDRSNVALDLLVATDSTFEQVIVRQAVSASRDRDFTVRCFVGGLQPSQHYYYRFVARDPDAGSASRIGRTRTAPRPDADDMLRLAVFSCQDYERGFFTAYRHLLEREQAGEEVDLCLHVGDYIYEWVGEQLVDLNREPFELHNPDGSPRRVDPFPSGGKPARRDMRVPQTLEDYRTLYRSYLGDPDLQEARARYPFMHIWDDHEVANDYWQSYVGEQGIQTLKVLANQAWFEYLPAVLDEAPTGAAGYNGARSFRGVAVEDAPPAQFDDHYLSHESNNLAAIGSLGIYRSLRWGRHVDFLLIDGRSFRGPRGVESGLLSNDEVADYPDRPLDPQLVRTLNAGRRANDNSPPSTVEVNGRTVENPSKSAPCASMLGETQKQWLKESLQKSDATWCVLCNNVPMMRFGFDTRMLPDGYRSGLFWTDGWDGYPLEREELMNFIRSKRLTNIVSVTGDRHANFAGTVTANFDEEACLDVIPEFVGASVSAPCRSWIQDWQFQKDLALHQCTMFDGSRAKYRYAIGPNLNAWLLFGAEAATAMHTTLDPTLAQKKQCRDVNPHLVYADTDAFGYYTMTFNAHRIETEFVVLPEPIMPTGGAKVAERRRVSVRLPGWEPGDTPQLETAQTGGEALVLGLREIKGDG